MKRYLPRVTLWCQGTLWDNACELERISVFEPFMRDLRCPPRKAAEESDRCFLCPQRKDKVCVFKRHSVPLVVLQCLEITAPCQTKLSQDVSTLLDKKDRVFSLKWYLNSTVFTGRDVQKLHLEFCKFVPEFNSFARTVCLHFLAAAMVSAHFTESKQCAFIKRIKPFAKSNDIERTVRPFWQRWPLPNFHCPLLPIVQKGKAPLHSLQYDVSCIPHCHRLSAMSFSMKCYTSAKVITRAAQWTLELLATAGNLHVIPINEMVVTKTIGQLIC